jgi:GNAT superfamily N-acetyltransferase
MHDVTLQAWVATFGRLHAVANAKPVDRIEADSSADTHEAIVASIRAERLLGVLADDERVVACGLGVLEGELFGLFDLVTAPAERGRGHGAALLSRMLTWAQARGAAFAYLQVARANLAARRVYAHLGFRPLYRYEYRIGRAA